LLRDWRRFVRGINNFFKLYESLFDTWTLFDNSRAKPVLIAKRKNGRREFSNEELFKIIQKGARERVKKRMSLQEKAFAALKKAVRQVVERHKKTGRSLAVWHNGKVVRISPYTVK